MMSVFGQAWRKRAKPQLHQCSCDFWFRFISVKECDGEVMNTRCLNTCYPLVLRSLKWILKRILWSDGAAQWHSFVATLPCSISHAEVAWVLVLKIHRMRKRFRLSRRMWDDLIHIIYTLHSKQVFGYFCWSSHFGSLAAALMSTVGLTNCRPSGRFHELSNSEGQVFSAETGWENHWDWLRNHLKSLEIPKFLQWSRA